MMWCTMLKIGQLDLSANSLVSDHVQAGARKKEQPPSPGELSSIIEEAGDASMSET